MRSLLENEMPLVTYLLELANLSVELETIRVVPMEDGGMGSLSIAPVGRSFGSAAAECHFRDTDGTLVSAALNLDLSGEPLEVDVWRVDFGPLAAWPRRADLRAGPPN